MSTRVEASVRINAACRELVRQRLKRPGCVVATATRDVTAESFAKAGTDLGYTVSVCQGSEATGIELRHDHEVLLPRIRNGGEIEADHARLVNATCGDRQLELEQAVGRRGVTLTNRRQRYHDASHGGNLITAAARRDTSLARATVAEVEPIRPAVEVP